MATPLLTYEIGDKFTDAVIKSLQARQGYKVTDDTEDNVNNHEIFTNGVKKRIQDNSMTSWEDIKNVSVSVTPLKGMPGWSKVLIDKDIFNVGASIFSDIYDAVQNGEEIHYIYDEYTTWLGEELSITAETYTWEGKFERYSITIDPQFYAISKDDGTKFKTFKAVNYFNEPDTLIGQDVGNELDNLYSIPVVEIVRKAIDRGFIWFDNMPDNVGSTIFSTSALQREPVPDFDPTKETQVLIVPDPDVFPDPDTAIEENWEMVSDPEGWLENSESRNFDESRKYNVLMVSDEENHSSYMYTRDLIESLGHDVTFYPTESVYSLVNTIFETYDLIVILRYTLSDSLIDFVKRSTIPILIGPHRGQQGSGENLFKSLGLASSSYLNISGSSFDITDNEHYITDGYAVNEIVVAYSTPTWYSDIRAINTSLKALAGKWNEDIVSYLTIYDKGTVLDSSEISYNINIGFFGFLYGLSGYTEDGKNIINKTMHYLVQSGEELTPTEPQYDELLSINSPQGIVKIIVSKTTPSPVRRCLPDGSIGYVVIVPVDDPTASTVRINTDDGIMALKELKELI